MTALLALTLTLAQADTRNDIVEQMNRARTNYEYGEYAAAEKLLSALVEVGRFESETLAVEAWRLLGLSRFYLGRKAEAVMQDKMKGLTGGLPLPPGLKLF